MRELPLFATADSEIEVELARGTGVQLRIETEGVARGGSGFAFPFEVEQGGRLEADGRWSIAGMPDCEWTVELQSPDYAFEPRRVHIESGRTVHELRFKATAQGEVQLHGTLATADGRALAGETLVCHTQGTASVNGGRPGTCTTDDTGRFSLAAPLVLGESYSLRLVDSRFVLQQTKTEGHTGVSDRRYLVRYEDEADPKRPLKLVAVPAAFVRGKVVDADGQPVPFRWCTLQVQDGHQWSDMAYATSRRDGTLTFPGVHALDVDLRIEAAGRAGPAYSEPFAAEAGNEVAAVVRVPRPGGIRGRLLDARGQPMVAAALTQR